MVIIDNVKKISDTIWGKSPSTCKNALRENRRAVSIIVRLRSTVGVAERRFDETGNRDVTKPQEPIEPGVPYG